MFDIKQVCEDPELFDTGMLRRGAAPIANHLIRLDKERRICITSLQDARSRRKTVSQEIGAAKVGKGDPDIQPQMNEIVQLKQIIKEHESEERRISDAIDKILTMIPNLLSRDVQAGVGESDNIVLRMHGNKPVLSGAGRHHFEIGEQLGLMDFDGAAKLSGSRFVVLKGELALLERALSSFMLDLHTSKFGYTEVSLPLLVREHALFGTGQLPKFTEEQFRTTNGFWLIPTAEVSLTNLIREEVLKESDLPIRRVACTPCFRAEAGAAGRDTRGMIRQHQFSKVELVSITTPGKSHDELERLCACAEEVLKLLGLHYRVMQLCAGETGFSACKTYDIEVWLPGQNAYREISSCSLCGDFQARRMRSRFRPDNGDPLCYVHTLNGSGLAVGRTLIAILENYQQGNEVIVPDVLRSYMGGLERITPKSS